MIRKPTIKSWRSAEQWLLGSMALALGTVAGIWLLLGPVPMSVPYFAALVLLIASLAASLIMMGLVGRTRRKMEAMLQGRMSAEAHAIETLRHSEAQCTASTGAPRTENALLSRSMRLCVRSLMR